MAPAAGKVRPSSPEHHSEAKEKNDHLAFAVGAAKFHGKHGGKHASKHGEEVDDMQDKMSLDAAQANNIKKMYTTALVSAQSWDIFSPPPTNTYSGKLVPKIMNRYQHRRKLSLEVHKVTLSTGTNRKDGAAMPPSYDEGVIRLLVPSSKQLEKEKKKEGMRRRRSKTPATVSDDVSVSADSVATESINPTLIEPDSEMMFSTGILTDTGGKVFDGWVGKYRIPCQNCTIKHQIKRSVFVLIEVQELIQERELIFDTLEDAQAFCQRLGHERQLEHERDNARLRVALGDITLPPMESITLLVEIVSGIGIPVGDISTSDAFVVCMVGRNEVHRTKPVFGTLDPIWTLKTDSLFLLTIQSRDLFLSEGLYCLIKDYDRIGQNDALGVVVVPPDVLYLGKGERMEFKILPPPGSKEKEVPGMLAIRVRRATENDKKFMEGYNASGGAVAATEHPKTLTNNIRSIVTRQYRIDKDGTKQYKVRPRPDPKRPEETEWMTKEALQEVCMQPSRHWLDAGSGDLGRVFVEVLGCNGLPNLDTGGFLGNKTDTFVALVFEDCYVRTDVIDDCLSPRWPPWSQRAFGFRIYHPSSQLLLGVFDYDEGFDDHDLIGRVSVDITNLRPGTEYVLSYHIYPSARISGREIQGQVTIRVRMEIDDERKLALSALEPPHPCYINVKNGKDFRVVRATCIGSVDYDKYSIKTIKSFVDELREFQHALFHISDAAVALLLWRGHFPLSFGSKTVKLPLHSLNAFIVSVVLVERPQLFPSFFFASIAWILLAVMGWKRNSAVIWKHCKSYGEIFRAVAFGETKVPPHSIQPFHNFDEAKAEVEGWMKRIEESEKQAEKAYIEAQELEQERLKHLEEIGDTDTDLSTKVGGEFTIDPIRAALHPLQILLGLVCHELRLVKHVIVWNECYFSFWIVTGCVILSVASVFVPWFFLFRWAARLVVWTLFGPWMKLVDIFYVSKIKPETEEEIKMREEQERMKRRMATSEAAAKARVAREDAAKMKEMKNYMFGKFAMKVPILKRDRYVDLPLAESSATPYNQKPMSLAEVAMQEAGYNRTRIAGQNLYGDMIPLAESETGLTSAPIGKPTAYPDKLEKNGPGGGTKKKTDSTSVAYAKITSVVAVAGVVTWFGVPFVASLAENYVSW